MAGIGAGSGHPSNPESITWLRADGSAVRLRGLLLAAPGLYAGNFRPADDAHRVFEPVDAAPAPERLKSPLEIHEVRLRGLHRRLPCPRDKLRAKAVTDFGSTGMIPGSESAMSAFADSSCRIRVSAPRRISVREAYAVREASAVVAAASSRSAGSLYPRPKLDFHPAFRIFPSPAASGNPDPAGLLSTRRETTHAADPDRCSPLFHRQDRSIRTCLLIPPTFASSRSGWPFRWLTAAPSFLI
jgi:hypothetical protein